jgi:hypothetical protein
VPAVRAALHVRVPSLIAVIIRSKHHRSGSPCSCSAYQLPSTRWRRRGSLAFERRWRAPARGTLVVDGFCWSAESRVYGAPMTFAATRRAGSRTLMSGCGDVAVAAPEMSRRSRVGRRGSIRVYEVSEKDTCLPVH